ncbi:MAG: hypothetical protein ACHQF2_00030 [Flavobacteriales bacterium]
MKTKILFVVMVVLTIASCNKYEEGPSLSLRSKKARLTGEWKADKFTLNGTDITSAFLASAGSDYTMHLDKDGAYHIHATFEDGGTWEFSDNKEELHMLSSVAGAEEEHFDIIKLKNKELWLRHTHDSEVYEYHYKK